MVTEVHKLFRLRSECSLAHSHSGARRSSGRWKSPGTPCPGCSQATTRATSLSEPTSSQRSTGAQRQVGTVSCPGSSQDSPSGPTAPWPRCDAHSGESNGAALCPFWTEAAQSTSPGLEMWDTLWDPGEEHSGTLEHLLQDGRTQKFQRQENRWIKVIFQHRGQKGTVTGFFNCVDMPFEYSQSHILTKSHL